MLSKKIVKYIQSLSDKKFRDKEGVFVAEGPKVVSEFLLSGSVTCRLLIGDEEWLSTHRQLVEQVDNNDVVATDDHWLKSISSLKTPNKVVAVFEKKNYRGSQC